MFIKNNLECKNPLPLFGLKVCYDMRPNSICVRTRRKSYLNWIDDKWLIFVKRLKWTNERTYERWKSKKRSRQKRARKIVWPQVVQRSEATCGMVWPMVDDFGNAASMKWLSQQWISFEVKMERGRICDVYVSAIPWPFFITIVISRSLYNNYIFRSTIHVQINFAVRLVRDCIMCVVCASYIQFSLCNIESSVQFYMCGSLV